MNTTQRIIKYIAIAFAISLIIGIFTGIYQAVGVIGSILTDNSKIDRLDISKYSNTSSVLSINIISSKLIIKEGNELKVESNNKYITSKMNNNKLSITEKKHSFFKTSNNSKVTIYIPKDTIFDKIYIENGAGTINIQNLTAKDLELELGAGKLEIDKLTTLKDTRIDGGAGKVMINNANLNNLDLDIGVGKFTITGRFNGNTEIDAGVGELNINILDSTENYSIYTDTGIGSVEIDGVHAKEDGTYGNGPNKLSIDGGVGSINIDFKEK